MSFIKIKDWEKQTQTGLHNRSVSKTIEEGILKGFSKESSKKNADGYKKLSESIDKNGWITGETIVGFKCSDNVWSLLSGNLRREILIEKVHNGKLAAYPEIMLFDYSDEINPNTGKFYTYEEAEKKFNTINHNPSRKHTTSDYIDTEYLKNNPIAVLIRNIAQKYNISLTQVCDIVVNISGSSRRNQISDWLYDTNIVINPNAEHFANFIDVISHDFEKSNPNSIANLKSTYSFPAIYELYKASVKCGVRDEFCTIMKDCVSMKKPLFAANFNMPKFFQSKIQSSIYSFIADTLSGKNLRYVKHKEEYNKLINAWDKCNFTNVMRTYIADVNRLQKTPKINMEKIIPFKNVD